ncbi:MerR family transcriptional regulator [Alginatibacterium sediminis]|uniref:MerR family transcriptional regulator n=1 Tax=Alginatibacterium sediminis TaxID=2164068 RepID=A0A420ENH9_9ALTE|nr:MerR family transcriptional regulator [Alginatibacterium sediminis]RKF22228.1 MerR family transcriptional regulator [Alginatibacterium sediminis]
MYTIGEFSKITAITIKALRHYHEKGVLVPAHIDMDSGYRFYSEREIELAKVISTMKSMKFTLAEITDLLKSVKDESDLRDLLEQKKNSIDQDIVKLSLISEAIDQVLVKENSVEKGLSYSNQITIEELGQQQVLICDWEGEYRETGKAMAKLYRVAGRQLNGAPFNQYFRAEFQERAKFQSCLPIKKPMDTDTAQSLLVGGCFVSLVHEGSYESIGIAYKRVFDYIKEQDLKTELPIREVYLKGPGMIFKGNSKKYRTQILVPVLD